MTLVRIDREVYCLVHGTVHDETSDPYGYGTEEGRDDVCSPAEWRPIYWRARKGDYPS